MIKKTFTIAITIIGVPLTIIALTNILPYIIDLFNIGHISLTLLIVNMLYGIYSTSRPLYSMSDEQYKLYCKRKIIKYIIYIPLFIGLIIALYFIVRNIHFESFTKFLAVHNFIISFFFVMFLFQFTLRKSVWEDQNWKKIVDVWLKWNGVSVLTVGGFGFIAVNDDIKNKLINITTSSNVVDIRSMTRIYIVLVICIVLASIFTSIGRIISKSEETKEPIYWFVPAFIFSWISLTGSMILVVSSILLTIYAHIT